jgi:hypothetical protein
MQRTEYACDCCHRPMPAEQANQLKVDPVFVRPTKEANPEKFLKSTSERNRQTVSLDICDACFAELRGWLETRGVR